MWISKKSDWKEPQSDLCKYFIEKLKQQVDATEVISNKHRTTNGLTLISEIIKVAEMTKERPKYKNRLNSLLMESKEPYLNSNIVNDYIISNYFPDIRRYYKGIDPLKVSSNSRELKLLIIDSKKFFIRVEENYYNYIIKEVQAIDFSTVHFEKESKKIDLIIACFTTYVLYLGYSATSISDIAYRYVFKNHGYKTPLKIIQHFNGKLNSFKFLLKTPKDSIEFSFIKENLNEEHVKTRKVEYNQIKNNFLNKKISVKKGEELYELSTESIDPHNFVRILYDQGLKRYVANKDRLTLNYFTPFFNNIYWRFGKQSSENNHKYQSSKVVLDPINVPERPNTLYDTLTRLAKDFDFEDAISDGIPSFQSLLQPVYFYNLALGSKSIENSISLLWTTLEMLIPYRPYEYDIENVQFFVSKSLSIGSVGRELLSFILRYIETNNINNNELSSDDLKAQYVKLTPFSLKKWADWLCQDYSENSKKDPYDDLKNYSNLLCKKFCELNNLYSGKTDTVSYWLRKIKSSELSIKYQLDRIYLHRNQIVHTGKFINEYSNLWSHLEWYVGKLLSYSIVSSLEGEKDLEKMFLHLHSKNEQIINVLESNLDKKIHEMDFLFEEIFEPTWQMF
ncbi:hypothetical protein EV195_10137 [Tenacibaculum skagerrakense]|uniref:Apea-like HEPN domain-containing protein n=1 Tax=Tenacibaculum skagerrakense TaxID=186571 RepID=A0A4R2P1E0_9FLAO|nr:hypothetical protein [Tenacibaculum skagerrakense]TCP27878.1 hypothetical protein EV195_10137 [Tenacibaculum skagerrakense]